MGDIAHHSLAALVDVDVLHRDLLFAAGAVFAQRLHLRRKGAHELVKCLLGAVHLRNQVDIIDVTLPEVARSSFVDYVAPRPLDLRNMG